MAKILPSLALEHMCDWYFFFVSERLFRTQDVNEFFLFVFVEHDSFASRLFFICALKRRPNLLIGEYKPGLVTV